MIKKIIQGSHTSVIDDFGNVGNKIITDFFTKNQVAVRFDDVGNELSADYSVEEVMKLLSVAPELFICLPSAYFNGKDKISSDQLFELYKSSYTAILTSVKEDANYEENMMVSNSVNAIVKKKKEYENRLLCEEKIK